MTPIADLTMEARPTTGEVPPALVGSSTTVIGNKLFVFGGRLARSRRMINHLYILDLTTLTWSRHIAPPDSAPPPQPRYFHSVNIYKHYLVVFGGMSHLTHAREEGITALNDVCLFDLNTLSWVDCEVQPSLFAPQARYAHLAVCVDDQLIVMGGQDVANQYISEMNTFDLEKFAWIKGEALEPSWGAYRAVAFVPTETVTSALNNSVCVYSNHNFTDVIRNLQRFDTLRSGQPIDLHDHSSDMTGPMMPPGLRFPAGHLLGHYFILTGTYLSSTENGFHVWAMNIATLKWTCIDTGQSTPGSWNRAVLSGQRLYLLGNRDRDLHGDYQLRQMNFDHVAIMDLEAHGICACPRSTCSIAAQQLGLTILNQSTMADLEIITSDQKSIRANTAILAQRWPYFVPRSGHHQLLFPETYKITLAFLQYIYTDHLLTAEQHEPETLARLLVLADMYNMDRLKELATYAMHQILTISTARLVYETATLTMQFTLQVRALRVMIHAKKILQQQPPTAEPDWIYSPQICQSPTSTISHRSLQEDYAASRSLSCDSSSSIDDTPQSPRSVTSPSIFSFRRLAFTAAKSEAEIISPPLPSIPSSPPVRPKSTKSQPMPSSVMSPKIVPFVIH
ncbi:hypothetical protein DFQ28_002329 [Apophysomyces sp. BC1034]|nr:hypothetical protein DFQ30_001034 [Apophysomyces sp. BC1015]KAG0183137.1 hypothetical protein DFQ29_009835 [Apophysomyces sp. BC1021]KAG0193965.1 hypothetical protein DFQ28_002329 [Apophysomyces sp. BC1034]